MKNRKTIVLLLVILLCLSGCSLRRLSDERVYQIGIDFLAQAEIDTVGYILSLDQGIVQKGEGWHFGRVKAYSPSYVFYDGDNAFLCEKSSALHEILKKGVENTLEMREIENFDFSTYDTLVEELIKIVRFEIGNTVILDMRMNKNPSYSEDYMYYDFDSDTIEQISMIMGTKYSDGYIVFNYYRQRIESVMLHLDCEGTGRVDSVELRNYDLPYSKYAF